MKIRIAGISAAVAAGVVALVWLSNQSIGQPAAAPGANVDGAKIANADADPGEWLSHGRTYSEQRFSPLDKINTTNVKNLGVAWEYRTYSVRGLEATPIVSDGVMFITLPWSKVIALDAKSGKELWQYDPKVPGATGRFACCDVVNRGVALWKGAVYVGTLDGRLIKLDSKTGKMLWTVDTVENHAHTYTITGAPRVFDGLVVIGNGGAEYDSRGYISAFDANTGKKVWRFHVVPGDPSKPQENAALTAALKTWDTTGKYKFWKIGGGGAPWNSMAYDPQLDLVYFGTGNGNPWNRELRSPKGGDNLYLSSVVALHAKTGQFAWAYQTTPGDTWDFDSTADVVLADLKIGGKMRHVLMHAPKNGFFYVIDRATGKLISAQKFATVTWAKSIDIKTGRPVEEPDARYTTYSPQTGLVYIPAMDAAGLYVGQKDFKYHHGAWNLRELPEAGRSLDRADALCHERRPDPRARDVLHDRWPAIYRTACRLGRRGRHGRVQGSEHGAVQIQNRPGPSFRVQAWGQAAGRRARAGGHAAARAAAADGECRDDRQGLHALSSHLPCLSRLFCAVRRRSARSAPDAEGCLGLVRRHRSGRRTGRQRHGLVQGRAVEGRCSGDQGLHPRSGACRVGSGASQKGGACQKSALIRQRRSL